MPGPYFDTMVADYLLNPNRRAHTLDDYRDGCAELSAWRRSS